MMAQPDTARSTSTLTTAPMHMHMHMDMDMDMDSRTRRTGATRGARSRNDISDSSPTEARSKH